MSAAIPKIHSGDQPCPIDTRRSLLSSELRTRVGVTNLMATYQFLADAGRIRELVALFAPDAVFNTNNERFVGIDAITGLFTQTGEMFRGAGFLPARHHLSSIQIDVSPDGTATTCACFQYIGTRGLDHWGTYRDKIAPVGVGWQFVQRWATVEGCVPASPFFAMLGSNR